MRVLCLTHDRFSDKRTGLLFEPVVVAHPDHGGRVILGMAEVDAETVATFYAKHPSFHVVPEPNARDANAGTEVPDSPSGNAASSLPTPPTAPDAAPSDPEAPADGGASPGTEPTPPKRGPGRPRKDSPARGA
jgi:hypothetical protein